jgi:hypothetical protein
MIRPVGKIALTTRRQALRSGAGIFQCGDKIFLALALEFFLRGFEAGDACCDFFPLLSGVVRLFGHAHPF